MAAIIGGESIVVHPIGNIKLSSVDSGPGWQPLVSELIISMVDDAADMGSHL